MATLSQSESRHLYWWWSSHISTKNSKWLQDNLTDVDVKVKAMVKLIEEDADSFAKRAEMYYKKRPELMKLVEDVYRAYRALAAKYDNATGALRQAHRTMAEAFPNQVPFVPAGDSPSGFSDAVIEPHTPDTLHPIRATLDPEELHKDALGGSSSHFHATKRSGSYSTESDSVTSKKGLKQLDELFGSGEGTPHQNLSNQVKTSSERVRKVEIEAQALKDSLAKLEVEKEAALLQYQHSLDRLSHMEAEVSRAQEEATRLSSVVVMGVAKLSSTEEQYFQLERENESLQTEVDSLVQMMDLQKQEFSEMQEELERLQTSIEEECSRSMEAEAALKNLHKLHSDCQEELEALSLEVQHGAERLKDKEIEYQGLKGETQSVKEENKVINEKNMLLVISEKNLQNEIIKLVEAEKKLDKEVEVLVDQRNALQQEMYCLKDEMTDLKKQHLNLIEQMELVGLKPDCLGSSVKSLRYEISKLKEIHRKDEDEKSEKLNTMDNLLEKNALLENSLLDMNSRLELLREKVKALEEACQSLRQVNSAVVDEKVSLIAQLEIANWNVEKLSEKTTFLETFLFDANVERAWLREKSNSLEEFCQSLDTEKHDLFIANNNLVSQLKSFQQKLDGLGRKYADLEENHSFLEKEMESKIHHVKELQATLNLENQEHATRIHSSETQLAHLESENQILHEEGKRRMKELEDEQDKTMKAQLEIFIVQRCIQDMEERSISLFIEYQKQLETSKLSANLVTNLESEKSEQQVILNSLLDQVEKLRVGIRHMALSLNVIPAYESQVGTEEYEILLQLAMRKIEELEISLWSTQDEKHQLVFEKSVLLTLLGQLRLEGASIESERSALNRELKLRTADLLLLQSELNILKSASDHLSLEIGIGKDKISQKEMELSETEQKLKNIETQNMELHGKLQDMNGERNEIMLTREVLEKQILNISESNTHKNKEIEHLHEATEKLELELNRLHEEIKELRVEEKNLSFELQQKRNEIKLWEFEAESLYDNFQIADIRSTLFKEKVHELAGACESLEDESDSKTDDIEQLKKRLQMLESENKGVKSELAAYLPVLVSLRETVVSLEDHVISQSEHHVADNQEREVADLASHQQDDDTEEQRDNQSILAGDGISDLLELQTRIKTVESFVVEQKRLESVDKIIKVEAALKEIQKLEQVGNKWLHGAEPHFSEGGNDILVKDIPLDQVSHCSSYDRARSKREDADKNKEILELWEIVEKNFDLDLKFSQEKKLAAVPIQETSDFSQKEIIEERSRRPSSENMSVVSETSILSNGVTMDRGTKRRIVLERLSSDAQKLTNLQVTVQDMNKMAEQLDKCKKANNAPEFNTVKEQLREVQEGILQLIGTNGKLSKRAEGNVTVDLEASGHQRKFTISERARRASEKIGRLQVEVQRIQFVLLKLEDKYKTQVGSRVLLKDYIYGHMRSPPHGKRKKRLFFPCVKAPSKLD